MDNRTVLLETDSDGIASVTLNRPDVNNAYNGAMIEGLLDAFSACARDAAVRVVVLRGRGRHFQAGADLRWLDEVRRQDDAANIETSRRTAAAVRDLNEFPKPVVALVQGACFGGGVGIVAACDVAIASEEATFAITEARWGLAAGIIVPQLTGAIGPRHLRRYALTGERFGAAAARAAGLVHEVCPTGGLEAAAAPIHDALLRSAPDSLVQTKRTALSEAGLVLDAGRFERLVHEHAAKRLSEEAAEGLASFAEKRDPAWYPRRRTAP
jgi:methylglutaconyl-CoA hydratase